MRNTDILATAFAPAIWGSTYIVTTEFLPPGYPMTVAMLRAMVLGALNFALFWAMLFVAAYRLPGGVAATVGAIQPLVVVFVARALLGRAIRPVVLFAAVVGFLGVALLVLTPSARLDPLGVAAGGMGAVSMAFGTVLSRRWQPPVSPLTFTAWQLTAGGLLLSPVAWALEPPLPALSLANGVGIAYLGLIGAALTYLLWFRGVARLEPSVVASLGFLSPLVAVGLGWGFVGQALTAMQVVGVVAVIGSIWLSQRGDRPTQTAAEAAAVLKSRV